MSDLEFGIVLPAWSEHARPEGWRRVARVGEAAGFDALWRGDHVLFPEHVPRGAEFATMDANAFDVFQVLAFVAAVTDDVAVGTNVCVVPYRHPAYLAKLALSLDNLSTGRFEFGIGVGSHRSEFEALGVPWEERGSRTDEFLRLFERVLAEPDLAFEGPHHSFGRVGFHPRPVGDGPPIWVGGRSGAAIRRAARFGVGWTMFEQTPASLRENRERLLAAWDDQDRDGEPEIAMPLRVDPDGDPSPGAACLTGDHDADRKTIGTFRDAGATRINCSFRGLSIDRRVDLIESLGATLRA